MNGCIDCEIILQRKLNTLMYVYIMIIIIILLSLIIFFMLFNYKTYYKVRGIVETENANCYIKIYVPLKDLKYITGGKEVIINKKSYLYEILNIDSEYSTDNKNTYQGMTLKVNLPSTYSINNLTLDLKFIKSNKKVINYILKKG